MTYTIYTRKENSDIWRLIYGDVNIDILTGYIARTSELRKYYNTELKIITN